MVRRTGHEPGADEIPPDPAPHDRVARLVRAGGSRGAWPVLPGFSRTPARPTPCALLQGILIVRLSIPLPWGGGLMTSRFARAIVPLEGRT